MVQSTQLVPQNGQQLIDTLLTPIAWLPDWHALLINVAWYGSSVPEVVAKRALILLPTFLLLAAMWSTMLSVYTLPFRSGRGEFLTTLMTAWWDMGRSIWLYVAGLGRVCVLLVGWIWSTVRFMFGSVGSIVRRTAQSPLDFLDWTTRHYFKPGVPWIAFLGLLIWGAVEAVVFTYTLRPTLTEVLAGLTGLEPDPRMLTPILWLFLYFLILGSFASIQALAEALKNKRYLETIQMVTVEMFVMFFEVLFLYREMIDALTPWIAQQTGEELLLGLWGTLALASFGWVGVRGMTWFLFGRYGTPALLAVLARETVKQSRGKPIEAMPSVDGSWEGPIAALKKESEWFRSQATYMFELITLPVLQLFAAAINFVVIVISSRPLFTLPFKDLDDILAVTPRFRTKPKGWQEPRVPIAQEQTL